MGRSRSRAFLTVGGAVIAAGIGLAAMLTSAGASEERPALAAGAMKVDAAHSVVVYKIKHMKASHHYGMFAGPTGSFTIDAADPSKCALDVTVKVDSLNSGNAKRDQHLKTPDFFSAKEFPTIVFKSKSFTKGEGSSYTVAGDLTLHGVTKPVTAVLAVTGTNSTPKGEVVGVEATFAIKRTDFGMKSFVDNGMLGDDVSLVVALEGNNLPEEK